MTGRTVPPWVGKHPDQAIPKSVRLHLFEACGGICALSGRKIRVGDVWHLDHRVPLADGGEHSELNLQVVLSDAHKTKTKDEAGVRAKVRRVRMKHEGAWPKSKFLLRGRGFPSARDWSPK